MGAFIFSIIMKMSGGSFIMYTYFIQRGNIDFARANICGIKFMSANAIWAGLPVFNISCIYYDKKFSRPFYERSKGSKIRNFGVETYFESLVIINILGARSKIWLLNDHFYIGTGWEFFTYYLIEYVAYAHCITSSIGLVMHFKYPLFIEFLYRYPCWGAEDKAGEQRRVLSGDELKKSFPLTWFKIGVKINLRRGK